MRNSIFNSVNSHTKSVCFSSNFTLFVRQESIEYLVLLTNMALGFLHLYYKQLRCLLPGMQWWDAKKITYLTIVFAGSKGLEDMHHSPSKWTWRTLNLLVYSHPTSVCRNTDVSIESPHPFSLALSFWVILCMTPLIQVIKSRTYAVFYCTYWLLCLLLHLLTVNTKALSSAVYMYAWLHLNVTFTPLRVHN